MVGALTLTCAYIEQAFEASHSPYFRLITPVKLRSCIFCVFGIVVSAEKEQQNSEG